MKHSFMICLFIAFGIDLFYIKTLVAEESRLRFYHVKLDGVSVPWGEYKFDRVVFYEELNQDGVPNYAKFLTQFKHITFIFGLSDSSSGSFRYKLIDHSIKNNPDWSAVKNFQSVTFKNLRFSKFTFIIQYLNHHKVVQEKIFTFEKIVPSDDRLPLKLFEIGLYSFVIFLLIVLTKTKPKR